MQRAERGNRRVEQALGNLLTIRVQHAIGGHQVADVAHQHQTAAGQRQRGAIATGKGAIRLQAPRDRAGPFRDHFLEVAAHQTKPVAIDHALVGGIHRRNRILAVLNGGNGGFEHHVLDPGGMSGTDGMLTIKLNLDVQAVMAQENRFGLVLVHKADQLIGIDETRAVAVVQYDPQIAGAAAGAILIRRPDRVGNGVSVAGADQGHHLVQKLRRSGDDELAARRVVARAFFAARRFRDDVGAIQRIVEAAPARVRGVQGIARVHDRHYQLGAGDARDLVVDARCFNHEVGRLGQQVADLLQKRLVGRRIERLSASAAMPVVNRGLQRVASLEQRPILRREVSQHGGETRPESRRINARARRNALGDQGIQFRSDPEATAIHASGCAHAIFSR